MERTERIKKLKESIEILKSEFIGLDSILDELETAICPWYVTPEVIKRPQIVSLWGMTGTGKTSVIRRLIELLDLSSTTLFFDCGEDGENHGITDKINDYLGDEEGDYESGETGGKRLIYVFDEFQYARTLDNSGEEVNKSGQRAIWNLIDSGVINLTDNGWDTSNYTTFLEDFGAFVKDNPNLEVSECNLINQEDVKKILDDMGLLYFDRGVPGFMRPRRGSFTNMSISEEDYKDDDDPYRPLRVVQDDIIRILRRKLSSRKSSEYFKEVLGHLREAKTTGELYEILEEQKKYVIAPKYINCSDSLIFILGNLDEAYRDSRDFNPDLDADMFASTTSQVSIGDIKEALKKRFRPEQISRFGNNIIKYPCLGSEHFKEIINSEVHRLCSEFLDNFGISVTVEDDFKELLYSEGVYPVQGVRPVFTTIGYLLTPLFSKILIFLEPKENKSEYRVKINLHGQTDLKKPEIRVYIEYSDAIRESVSINLQLGAERNPESRKTRVINSVHESGHAIVMAYLTGVIPYQVISVSIDHGGFCMTYDPERDSEIMSKKDVADKVCIGLAGYEAECMIYKERPEMIMCGSSSDITSTWDLFSQEAYKGGYFEPFCYSAILNEQSSDGVAFGYSDKYLTDLIKSEFDRLRKTTQKILADNKNLLVKMARILADRGGIKKEDIEVLIRENLTGTLNSKRLEEAARENDYGWYLEELGKN